MASLRNSINKVIPGTDIILLQDQALGRGAYGRVFKAKYRGSLCAAKEIHSLLIEIGSPADRRSLQEKFARECDHCSKLNHPNIVHFIGIYHPPQQLFPVMIMELMDESLTDYAKPNVSFMNRISILHDVAEGLSYLHSRNPPVIHRDLSPNNILLKHLPVCSVAKIADLGVARMIHVDGRMSSQYLTKVPGTVDFMPPEAFPDKANYDTSLDVFSYGGIILHTINGEWPTPTKSTDYDRVKCRVIGFNEVERRQKHLDKMTEEADALKPLVKSCLDYDPAKRLSIFELSERIKAIKNQKEQKFVAQKIESMVHKGEDISKKHRKLTISGTGILSKITRGTYSQLYTVKHGQLICIAKEIDSELVRKMGREESRRFHDNFIRECCHCSEHIHSNIVRLEGIYYPSRRQSLPVAVVMEYMNETLTSYLNAQNVTFERKILILHDVAEGLNYLHNACNPPVIHCNLSTDHILLKHLSIFPVAKISSFSMRKVLLADSQSHLPIALESSEFMPPELFADGDTCSTSLDVFSYGALMLHTICGERPIPTARVEFETLNYETKGFSEVERHRQYLDKLTGKAVTLKQQIEKCLDNDPANRPKIEHLSELIKKELPTFGKGLQSDCFKFDWKNCADLKEPLYGASVAVHGNKVYTMAGGAPEKETYNHVFVYDIHSNEWGRLPSLSGHRRGILQIIDNKLTIIGGQDSNTRKITNKVTSFQDDRWLKIFSDMQKPRIQPGVVVHQNYVIVAGGAVDESTFSNDIELLNWKQQSDWVIAKLKLPEPMWFLSLTISGDSLYIVGYNRSNDRTTTAYKVLTDAITLPADQLPMHSHAFYWHRVPKAPHAGTAIIPNSCPPVIVGGYNHQGFTSDISILDGNSWKRIASLTTPIKYAAVVSISPDSILVIGGCTGGKGMRGAMSNCSVTVDKGTMQLIQ